jgi:putative ABC transport system substrate-binding protein
MPPLSFIRRPRPGVTPKRPRPKVGIRVVAAGVHDAGEVERAITAVAAQPNGGLVVCPLAAIVEHARKA